MSAYLRGGLGLPAKFHELTMLTVVPELDCWYIWKAMRRREGLSNALADSIR
ncbi:MAG: hypothetical protein IH962_04435, partial [Chloroflexi bacterium]|nr:hypothetical protein [Chloroflexota bacterium]